MSNLTRHRRPDRRHPAVGSAELQGARPPWYSDQALPFEITVVAANEYGAAASAKLFGVEILNEGWGMSIDDSVNEMQATFVARSRR